MKGDLCRVKFEDTEIVYEKLDIFMEAHTNVTDIYYPSVTELVEHAVEDDFDKYAPYLMYLAERLDESIKNEEETNLSLSEMKQTAAYLRKLFTELITE